MNRIRTAAAAVALLIGVASVTEAQAPERQQGGRKAQRGAHGAMGQLDLSDSQKDQIKAIHAKYRTQFEQLRAQSRPDMEAARAARQRGDTAAARAAMTRARSFGTQVAALRQQEQAEVRAVLTAEQRTRLDARQAQMRERRAQHDSARKGVRERRAQGDSGRRGARPRGMQGRRPNRGARPARPGAGN